MVSFMGNRVVRRCYMFFFTLVVFLGFIFCRSWTYPDTVGIVSIISRIYNQIKIFVLMCAVIIMFINMTTCSIST